MVILLFGFYTSVHKRRTNGSFLRLGNLRFLRLHTTLRATVKLLKRVKLVIAAITKELIYLVAYAEFITVS